MHPANTHPQLLRADNVVLVVVDMQEPFLRNLFVRERMLSNVCTLLDGAQILEVPVIATTQYAERMGGVVPEVQERLQAAPVLDKMAFSCWNQPFRQELQRSNRKQVLLCGAEAHICVSQTARDLLAAGYEVHLVEEAVSSRTEANANIGFAKMRLAGVIPASVESALYELLGRAGTPAFREILKLIK
jgi:nicotinamidase-related amidase